jgi:hypothetical protein
LTVDQAGDIPAAGAGLIDQRKKFTGCMYLA